MKRIAGLVMVLGLTLAGAAWGKMDLVTLPGRDAVQLTIYNSADLTLVRETRQLTLKKGLNRLQFSWANTLIDPTSLEMTAKAQGDKIEIFDLTYPAGVQGAGVWSIRSEVSGKVPVEITYLTSGFSWRAFYMGTLSGDEKEMKLEGYVRVENRSGEDYEEAQTRMIVGKVHMLDEIAELARRQYPYGRPGYMVPFAPGQALMARNAADKPGVMEFAKRAEAAKPKEIVKEGLSEYFLYTIEGRETIENGWSKRLPSFEAGAVPVANLYKYEEERYGAGVVRFLSFKNDAAHKLGQTPIPDGMLRVHRETDKAKHLSYEGQSGFKYIPVGEKVELNLGAVGNVVVKPTVMGYRTDNYQFDVKGDVSGWDELREWKVEVKNTREVPVRVEVRRNLGATKWELEKGGEFGAYEKVDLDTVKFTLQLDPRSKKEFTYTLRTYQGTRAQ